MALGILASLNFPYSSWTRVSLSR